MSNELTRRQMIRGAGLALGGVVGAGVLQACSGDAAAPPATTADGGSGTGGQESSSGTLTTPKVSEFPYQQHLPAGYRLEAAPVKETAYHGYYAGGCCHGAFSSLVGHLATTAGAPFDQLPLDFGKFGSGGIAGYGSICGAVLGGVLVINMLTSNATARGAMMTDLMRWYERTAFPQYVPTAIDAGETGLALDFSGANLPRLQVQPGSHLCHASVSGWCARNQVSAAGNDKKARCARLTADVSGKVVEMVNAYLSGSAYTAAGIDALSGDCLGCHGGATPDRPVAAGMQCAPCHGGEAYSQHPL